MTKEKPHYNFVIAGRKSIQTMSCEQIDSFLVQFSNMDRKEFNGFSVPYWILSLEEERFRRKELVDSILHQFYIIN